MLELRNISAGYDAGPVLRDVDVVVPDKSVVALIGPNGAGKSTLLRVASGLLKPSSGSILVDGVDATGREPYQLSRRGVCHVPEGRGIFRGLTVEENLRLQAGKAGARGVEIAVTSFPRLGERLKQVAGSLSGGEQQMLSLARAYLTEPSVVLLDEVSMGLAPKIVDEIFDRLRILAQQGTALLIVEQYVARALDLADVVYILGRGQVQFVGEPYELSDELVHQSYLGGLAS
jgi:branched-chain amino acid transport system ATP-binding protein